MSTYSSYDEAEKLALVDAREEANRFLTKSQLLLDLHDRAENGDPDAYLTQTPLRSAAKRASLDLTKSLAQFRKSRFYQ